MIEQYYIKEESNGKTTYKPVDMSKITICGKTVEEIINILRELDLEKIYEMDLTMKNLKNYIEIYEEEHSKILQEQLSKMSYEVDKNWGKVYISSIKEEKETEE